MNASPIDSVGAAYYYEVSFEGKTGAVEVTVGGKSSTGPEISGNCPASGAVSSAPTLTPITMYVVNGANATTGQLQLGCFPGVEYVLRALR